MRPKSVLRATGAIAALGALAFAPQVAQRPPAAHARAEAAPASVADVAVGRAKLNVVAGRRASVHGRIAPAVAGRRVALERRTGRGWRAVDGARTGAGGRFAVRFRPRHPVSAAVRVRAGVARTRVGRLNVFRHARVSWYGPGLYGNHLGCGGRLTTHTLGVAHKTLPCGTRVTLRYRGRTVRVPVVDRGPYVAGREFDLTAATKRRLRFEGVHTIMVTR
jgi:rare lipoprotein A (peptidoglycan hydrolase)